MLNYILPLLLVILTTFLALLDLIKDWKAYKKPWLRIIAVGSVILIGIGTMISTYYSTKNADKQHAEDQKKISGLKEAVDTANQNQKDNTALFLKEFEKISQKVNDLNVQIKTADLREEADKLKTDLESTRKALIPPKATLFFTFLEPTKDGTPLKRIALPVKDDIVHVEFSVLNSSTVTAQQPEIVLIICDACEYASEPDSFKKLDGSPPTRRNRTIGRILPNTKTPTMTADVKVPKEVDAVNFGILYRCDNCDAFNNDKNIGIIDLLR